MIISIFNKSHKELSNLLISIAISTIMIIVSNSWWQTTNDEKITAYNKLLHAKDRYYTALKQKELLKKFEAKFKHLKESGIVGDEDRLNWVDTIEKITSKYKIPYLKYNVDKRTPFNSPQLNQHYPGISLYKSVMTLEMQLLHEGDLYTILNNLEKNAKGIFDIKSCTIVRNASQVDTLLNSTTDKNFSSKCVLNWYTMENRKAILPVRRRN